MSESESTLFQRILAEELAKTRIGSIAKGAWTAVAAVIIGTAFIVGIWQQNQAALRELTALTKTHDDQIKLHTAQITENSRLLAVLQDRATR